jgi:heterodisulfide reductase subunit A
MTAKTKGGGKGPLGSVLIVGGGISGMQSALDLADSDILVHLLDKKATIGGTMAQLDKTFPTNDCAMCIMAPKLVATGRHHNINLITNADVTSCEGEPGNFRVTLTQHPRMVDPEKCTGCGVCAQKCTMEAIDSFQENTMRRGAIYVDYPQAVPLVYRIDRDKCIGCGVCEGECKAKAIKYDDKEKEIVLDVGSVILSPGFDEFDPSVLGEYGYGRYLNVLTSIEFERLLSATGPHRGIVLRPSDGDIPAKVAFLQCVGSRDERINAGFCSSVCCMYSLKEAVIAMEHTPGLNAHVFFMDVRAFGKEFDDYVNRAQEEFGIKVTRHSRIPCVQEVPGTGGLVLRYEEKGELREEEFDMVVLAVGLHAPRSAPELAKAFGIKLNDYNFAKTENFSPLSTSRPGVFVSGAFSGPKDIPTTVAEASGAAGKAQEIISSARGTLVTAKEFPPEVDVGGQEPRIGVFVCHCGINIGGVVDVPNVVEYAKTLPNVAYAEHNLYTCSQDTQERIKENILEHNLNRVIVASCTPRTHEPLFQNTIREGGLNRFLFEMANIRDQCSWIHMHMPAEATRKAKDLVRMAVAKASFLEPLETAEIPVTRAALVLGGGLTGMSAALSLGEQGFKTYLVEREKELGGNLRRLRYSVTGEDPQEQLKELVAAVTGHPNVEVITGAEVETMGGYVGNFETQIKGRDGVIQHGVIILATGAEELKPEGLYLYGEDDRVVTQLEFEEELAGKGKPPASVVMIQCVGSRNKERPWCSRVCCTNAVKNAIKVKEASPKTPVYVLYRDLRTYGFKEDYYRKAAEMGVTFLRFEDDKLPVVKATKGGLKINVEEMTTGETIQLTAERLVLSSAILPREDNEVFAQFLKVPISKDGFFLEAHMKLRPVDFATEGVYLAGMCHSPKFTDESIAQAVGAVARATTILSKESLVSEGIIAHVNEDICDGCGICRPVCEYNAIDIDDEKKLAVVNEGLCKGCGACVGTCPSGAMEQKGYKDSQLVAMIEAALQREVA